jgi:hypothetical protein
MKIVPASVHTRTRLQKRHNEPERDTLRGFTLVPERGTQVILHERIVRRAPDAPEQAVGAASLSSGT